MRLIPFLLIALFLASATAAKAENLRFCYDPYPPYTYGAEGPAAGGLKVELLEAVMERIDGVSATVTLLPWKRCQAEARAGNFDGILPLFPNAERAGYLAFSDPTFAQRSSLWHRAGQFPQGFAWSGNMEEIVHLRLGMLTGAYIDADMEAAFENALGITRARDIQTLMQLLVKGRVDLVAADTAVGQHIVNINGWQDEATQLGRPISIRASHFGLSKASGASRYLPAFNAAIAALRENGTIEALQAYDN